MFSATCGFDPETSGFKAQQASARHFTTLTLSAKNLYLRPLNFREQKDWLCEFKFRAVRTTSRGLLAYPIRLQETLKYEFGPQEKTYSFISNRLYRQSKVAAEMTKNVVICRKNQVHRRPCPQCSRLNLRPVRHKSKFMLLKWQYDEKK